ncbi:hypothetical protein [uncultured Litoreibacter sp.]|uniref:hypothetical protein n=1 Tax=uncultured Litoreibacter sp. TaxID=1392394 RepID=UPI00260E06E5|nr:hypothetical protein [uncultured Litoreibacter sp.]
MFRRAILLAIALAGPVWADYAAGNFSQAQTRFGALQIVGDIGSQRVLFNGSDLGITNHAYHIEGVWAVEGGSQDWAVLFSRHGGNMCGGGNYLAIMLTNGSATRTDEFGTCRGRAIDVRVTPDMLELDVSDPAPRVSHQTFRFDGAQLTQTAVAQAAAPAAGLGADITRWLQQHPQALTQDPSEQARFARIMTPAQMDDMNRRMSGPGVTEQLGDWIVGRACQAHQCNAAAAAWALRMTDGAVFAVFYNGDNVAEVLYGDQHLSGPVVAQLLAGR